MDRPAERNHFDGSMEGIIFFGGDRSATEFGFQESSIAGLTGSVAKLPNIITRPSDILRTP